MLLSLGTYHLTWRGGYGYLFRSEFFFSDNTRIRIFIFFVAQSANFFSRFNIRLYDKNSESDYYFFPPPKSEYFFQRHWESEYFFRKKNIPPPFKLNGRSLIEWWIYVFYKLYKQGGVEICLWADSGLIDIKTSVNIILTELLNCSFWSFIYTVDR